jgi:hypothetical protein
LGNRHFNTGNLNQQHYHFGLSGAGFKSNWILLVQGLMYTVVLVLIVPVYCAAVPTGDPAERLRVFRTPVWRFCADVQLESGFALRSFFKDGNVFFLLSLTCHK